MEESELVDSYLKGNLGEDDMIALETRILNDPAFKNKVELRKLLIESIHSAYHDELKVKLKDLDRKIDKNYSVIKIRYMIAASIAFLLTTSFGIWTYLNHQSKVKFEKYDLYENGIPNVMGASDDLTLVDAMNYFKASDYLKALQYFEAISPSDTIAYYSGISAFRLGDNEKAIKYFQSIQQGSEYFTKANYRLGLALWKDSRVDQAIPVLMKAAQDSSSEYGANAKVILTEEF